MCGWGKEGTEQVGDSPGVTQLEDEVPKCSTHRGCLVLDNERLWGLPWCDRTLHLYFSPSPAWIAIHAKLLDGAGAVGPEGKGWGGTRTPTQAGVGAAQPSLPGDERSGRHSEHCTFGLLEDVEDVGAGDGSGLTDGHGRPAAHSIPLSQAAWGGTGR